MKNAFVALFIFTFTGLAHALNVGEFMSGYRGYYTTSYWIEGNDGLILIDTQFLPSDTIRFVETAERQTGKRVVLAIVVHPNPDKFNGVATLQARGIKVITAQQVKDRIPVIHDLRLKWFYDDYKPDYPKDLPNPDVFGDKTTTMTVAGIPLTLHLLDGPGCSLAHVVVQAEDHIFVGDLIANGSHSWMEFGLMNEWFQRLMELRAMNPTYVHPGRGRSGGTELIDAQALYLRIVNDMVAAERPTGNLGWFRKHRLWNRIIDLYPHYHFRVFVWDGLPSVWRVQADKRGK